MGECVDSVAIRPLVAKDREALLRTMLSSADYGVMLTDLDHVTIAANETFGKIFDVDIHDIVHSDVLSVRERVAHLIPDMDEWEANLSLVYSESTRVQVDELVLLRKPKLYVRRWTGPVRDESGLVVGRLWTFLDTTQESRLRAMGRILYDVSLLFDEDPRKVYQAVVDSVAKFYGSNSMLSILVGDTMEFYAVSSPIPEVRAMKQNKLKDSYCQFALEAGRPLAIQNALEDERYCTVLPATLGFTRYLGVPVNEPAGGVIGTLCILDGESATPLDDEDQRFMSLMAMRVSSELARENATRERLAEKERVMRAQESALETTRDVLGRINDAFELLAQDLGWQDLVKSQTNLLAGVLGYDSAAVVMAGDDGLDGFVVNSGGRAEAVNAKSVDELAKALGGGQRLILPLRNVPVDSAFVVLGSTGEPPHRDGHHEAHLEALLEQVSLLLTARLLQQDLNKAYEDLKATQQQLVRTEKLSVVGTLAAATAHDIKNILASVTIELGMGHENPERALSAVKLHMDRFTVLAHRLLSYARPQLVAMRPVDVATTIQHVLALTSAQTRITGVTVVQEGLDRLPNVMAEPQQLEHLFVNLVLNAVQAMQRTGGNLWLSAKHDSDAVYVEVQDSGKGIDASVAGKLFEPFSTSRSDGFGLGLYSCKRIAEEHGGKIEVKSQPGKGTTFLVTLKRSSTP